MAFAGKLAKFEADMEDCSFLSDPQFKEQKEKLIKEFE